MQNQKPNQAQNQNQAQSQSSSSRINVPSARQALNTMKQEIAGELGVNLKQGYNGDLTSREAGSAQPAAKTLRPGTQRIRRDSKKSQLHIYKMK